MTNIKEQTIPTAYYREVNVDSTLKYMGEVITLLAKGTETNWPLHSWKSRYGPGTEAPPHIHEREHERAASFKQLYRMRPAPRHEPTCALLMGRIRYSTSVSGQLPSQRPIRLGQRVK
jgi:hypothetical protein